MTSPQRIIDNLSGLSIDFGEVSQFFWWRSSWIQALWMPDKSWDICRFLLLMFWRLHFNAKCPHSKLCDEYWWMGVSRLKLNQSWPWNFHIFWCVDSLKERCFCDDISMFLFFKGVESFEKWNLKVQKWYVCIYEYIYICCIFFNLVFFRWYERVRIHYKPCWVLVFLGLSATPCLSLTCTFFN